MKMSLFALIAAFAIFVSGARADSKVRITGISVLDDGSLVANSSVALVDTVQDICSQTVTDEETVTVYEPFFDTVAAIKVVNRLNRNIVLSTFSYKLTLNGSTFQSEKFATSARFEVAPGKTGTVVLSLFLNARNGRKYLSSSQTPIDAALGLKAVQFILEGRDSRGKRVRVQASTTVSFQNYDRC